MKLFNANIIYLLFLICIAIPCTTLAAPTVTVSINGAATYTNSTSVSLSFTVTGSPTQIYITNTSGCGSGGSWQAYASPLNWTLGQTNATARVYVKVKDAGGTSSTCVNDTIIHDNIVPTMSMTTPIEGAYVNAANQSSYTLKGACSVNGQSVLITGDISLSKACASSAWSTSANFSSLPDGPITVTANFADLAGNQATAVVRNLVKDTTPPIAQSIEINGGMAYTNSTSATLALSSDDATEMYITKTAGCASGGSWVPYSTTGSITLTANALNTINVKFRDAALNVSTCINSTITHDSTAPTLAVSSPINGAYIYSGNETSYPISGTCSVNGQSVTIDGDFTASAVCTAGTWSTNADLSSLSEGSVSFATHFVDLAGNAATVVNRTLTKDTTAPDAQTILINSGAAYTNSTSSTLTLAATGATLMYITNNATCSAGGAWAAYATSKAWTLPSANATNTVYVKFRDAALNESDCINASIIHDNVAPVAGTQLINGGATTTNSLNVTLTLVASGSPNDMYVTRTSGCGSGGTWEAFANSKSWTLANSNASNTVYVRFRDAAQNLSSCVSASITHDGVGPTATSISINSGAAATTSLNVTLTLAATGTPTELYLTQTAACAANGTWQAYATSKPWTLLNSSASNTVYVKFRDAALNESSCISASIAHDPTPTVTFTTPVSNYINSSNASTLQIGGSCSHDTRLVAISGAATTSATCTGGAWSTTVNVSGAADGSVTLKADMTNFHAVAATQASRTFTKDTVAPSGTFSISGTTASDSVLYTNSTSVTTVLSSANATSVYLTEDPLCQVGGTLSAYSTSLPWTFSISNGVATLYAQFRDTAGNASACLSASILEDNTPAVFTVAHPTNGFLVNAYNHSYFNLDGTCSDNGQPIVISGGPVGGSATCTNGTWSTTLTLYDLPEQSFSFNFNYGDNRGHTATQITRSVTRDSTYPTVALTGPAPGTWINISNKSGYAVNGTCSENGQPVVLSGAVNATLTCTAHTWSTTVDFTNSPQGNVGLIATHNDLAGNLDIEPVWINVDTIAPTVAVTLPSNGSLITNLNYGNFPLSGTCSDNGRTVQITGAATANVICRNNAWIARFDLTAKPNGPLTFNINYSDQAGNTTSDTRTYTKNASAPALTFTSPQPGYWVTAANMSNLTVTGTCGFSGGTVVLSGVFSATVPCVNNTWTKNVSLVSPPQGNVGIIATHNDGNGSSANNSLWININTNTVDTTPPNLTLTSLEENAGVASSEVALSGTCETPNPIAVSYGSGLSGPSTATCARNVFAFTINISGNGGARTLTLSEQDWASNQAAVVRNFNYVKKPEIKGQIFAIAQGADGSLYYGGDFSSYSSTRLGGVVRIDANGNKEATFDWKSAFDGNVYAVAELPDGSLIFGGDFTKYRGQRASRIAKVDANGNLDLTFCPQTSTGGADWTVYALTVSGSSIYAGGGFTYINDRPATRVAKLDFNGQVDPTFNTTNGPLGGANNTVRSLIVSGGSLYVGGDFTSYRGSGVKSIVKVSASTGAIDSSFTANGANGGIYSLLSLGGSLYLGGRFSTYQSQPANAIAKVDLSTGALDGTFSPSSGSNGFTSTTPTVFGLASLSGSIVAVGNFTSYRGAPANSIAKMSSSGALDTSFSPATGANGLNAQASSVITIGSDIYVGGSFTSYEVQKALGFAKISASGSLDTSFNPQSGDGAAGTDGVVNALLSASSGYMYLVGSFTSYRDSYQALNILKTDANGNIDLTFNAQNGSRGFNGPVRSLTISGTSIFAGGDFTLYGSTPVNRVAKLNMSGVLDSSFTSSGGADASVRAISTDGTSVYIGGDFLNAGGTPANRIAKLDASTGAVDTTFNPSTGANGTDNTVNTLALSGSDLYVGGAFLTYRGAPANRIAKINSSNGNLDTTFNPVTGSNGTNSPVQSILISGANLYIAGAFSSYRGADANRIAKISDQGILDGTFQAPVGTDGIVNGMVHVGSSLYLVTSGYTYGSSLINRIAKVDASTGSLNTSFSPSSGPNGFTGVQPRQPTLAPIANAILYDGSNLIVGGSFTRYRDQLFNYRVVIDTNGTVVP